MVLITAESITLKLVKKIACFVVHQLFMMGTIGNLHEALIKFNFVEPIDRHQKNSKHIHFALKFCVLSCFRTTSLLDEAITVNSPTFTTSYQNADMRQTKNKDQRQPSCIIWSYAKLMNEHITKHKS